MKTLLLAAAFTLGLTGCAATGVEQYRAEKPELKLQQYLNGQFDGWGMFQGRSGEVKKRFHVQCASASRQFVVDVSSIQRRNGESL